MSRRLKKNRSGQTNKEAAIARALRRLNEPGVSIVQQREDDLVVFVYVLRNAQVSLGGGKLKADTALELRTRGLVEGCGPSWMISDAGKAYLQRADHAERGFMAQHMRLEQASIGEGKARETVLRNAAESPLAWLRKRKDRQGQALVSDVQFEAGERLRRDFTHARLMPKVGMSWSPVSSGEHRRSGHAGGAADLAAHVIDARARIDRALRAVGNEFAGVLIDVCCLLRGLEDIEQDKGWPRRSGKLVLQLALTALARHYGLISVRRRPMRPSIRHWTSDEPVLDVDPG